MAKYVVIYKDAIVFGNFDENGNFYYYELVRYYNDIHNNKSVNICALDLLIKYNNQFGIEIIDKTNLNFLNDNEI